MVISLKLVRAKTNNFVVYIINFMRFLLKVLKLIDAKQA